MSKWEEKRLGEVCNVISGYAFKSNDFKSNGQIPVIKISNIGNGFVDIYNNTQYVDEKFLAILNQKYIVNNGDVLISLTGSHITQPNSMVGRTALYRKHIPLLLNQRAGKVIGKKNKGLDKFLYYNLRTQWIREYIGIIAHGAANQANISPKSIEDIKTFIPSFPIQQKIADILSAYDDLIENNNRRIELLEKAAQNLYKEWFVRFRFPNYKQTKFENGLPQGWKVVKLGDLYRTTSGGTPFRKNENYYINGEYQWIKTGELNDRFIIETEERITEQAIRESSSKLFKKDSLIMAMYGATIGKLGFSTQNSTCNQACCVFIPQSDEYSSEYLFFWLLANREYITNIGFGAAQQNLSQDSIKKIKILKPSSFIISEFNSLIKPIYSKIKNLQTQNQNLIKQRDLLLPRLMSGKLEV